MATTTESGFLGSNTNPTPFIPHPKEVEAFEHALKQPEFRAMLAEYAKEVSDPDNQKIYRKEMSEMEAQRGYMATFYTPQPGYVIKTRVLSCQNDQDEDSALGFGTLNIYDLAHLDFMDFMISGKKVFKSLICINFIHLLH